MAVKKSRVFRLVILGLLYSVILTSGCSFSGGAPQWSGSGFIRKELLEYDRVAVLPFQGDQKGEASDTFAENFREKFSKIELVKREQVLEVFQGRDLYSDRLDEAIRRKIGQVFGVQALIIGTVYYPSIFRWLLQIQVIDAESGQIMGRAFAEINYMGAEGMKQACRIAEENLTPE